MIEGLPVTDIGASALVAFVVILILTGRLVPRRHLMDVCEERDHWRRAAEERSAQLTALLPAAEVTTRAMEAVTNTTAEAQQQ